MAAPVRVDSEELKVVEAASLRMPPCQVPRNGIIVMWLDLNAAEIPVDDKPLSGLDRNGLTNKELRYVCHTTHRPADSTARMLIPTTNQTKETAAADPANLHRREFFPISARTLITKDRIAFDHINTGM